MIVYKKGDLLKSDCAVIAHGVNCQGVMSAGIALAIKNKYPLVFEDYVKLCKKQSSNLLGNMLPVFDEISQTWIINLFTQNFYGTGERKVSYDAVDTSMGIFSNWCIKGNIFKVGMPQIGAGLGGGNWQIISAIINANFKNITVEVYIL